MIEILGAYLLGTVTGFCFGVIVTDYLQRRMMAETGDQLLQLHALEAAEQRLKTALGALADHGAAGMAQQYKAELAITKAALARAMRYDQRAIDQLLRQARETAISPTSSEEQR